MLATEAECDALNCIDLSAPCDASGTEGDSCPGCCSGYCNSSGQCDYEPATCTGEGCACTTGMDGARDDGLVCCQTTDDRVVRACLAGASRERRHLASSD